MSSCETSREDLLAYLDDELLGAQRAAIEVAVRDNPLCRARLDGLRATRLLLCDRTPLRDDPAARARLRSRLRAEAERWQSPWRGWPVPWLHPVSVAIPTALLVAVLVIASVSLLRPRAAEPIVSATEPGSAPRALSAIRTSARIPVELQLIANELPSAVGLQRSNWNPAQAALVGPSATAANGARGRSCGNLATRPGNAAGTACASRQPLPTRPTAGGNRVAGGRSRANGARVMGKRTH